MGERVIMIVDDLVEKVGAPLCRLLGKSPVFRVPWPIAPLHEGRGASLNQLAHAIPRQFIPIDDGFITWGQVGLPYPSMVIASTNSEPGFLFVHQETEIAPWMVHHQVKRDDGERVIWAILFTSTPRGIGIAPSCVCIGTDGLVGVVHYYSQNGDGLVEWYHEQTRFLMEYLGYDWKRTWPHSGITEQGIDDTTHVLFSSATSVAALLSCKNIHVKVQDHPGAVQSKRVKRGKLPLYQYHTLEVSQSSTAHHSDSSLTANGDVALHWVRGHFKRYTADNKLFGKHTGLYWWQPHVAGTAERVVEKDYEISV